MIVNLWSLEEETVTDFEGTRSPYSIAVRQIKAK